MNGRVADYTFRLIERKSVAEEDSERRSRNGIKLSKFSKIQDECSNLDLTNLARRLPV